MKYEVLKPFSLDPGRSDMALVGDTVTIRNASRAADLKRSGLIAEQGEELTEEEQAAADAAEADKPVVDSVTHKSIVKAPSNKDAADQRKTK
jgi:hypothetical protein